MILQKKGQSLGKGKGREMECLTTTVTNNLSIPIQSHNCSCNGRSTKDGRNLALAFRNQKTDRLVTRRIYKKCKERYCRKCQDKFDAAFARYTLNIPTSKNRQANERE